VRPVLGWGRGHVHECMHVVGHENEFIENHVRPNGRRSQPFLSSDESSWTEVHVAIDDLAENVFPSSRADGHEVNTFALLGPVETYGSSVRKATAGLHGGIVPRRYGVYRMWIRVPGAQPCAPTRDTGCRAHSRAPLRGTRGAGRTAVRPYEGYGVPGAQPCAPTRDTGAGRTAVRPYEGYGVPGAQPCAPTRDTGCRAHSRAPLRGIRVPGAQPCAPTRGTGAGRTAVRPYEGFAVFGVAAYAA
jgi:hypothetical protein